MSFLRDLHPPCARNVFLNVFEIPALGWVRLGRTPLHTAVFEGDDERVEELLKSRAAVESTDKSGRTAQGEAGSRSPESSTGG